MGAQGDAVLDSPQAKPRGPAAQRPTTAGVTRLEIKSEGHLKTSQATGSGYLGVKAIIIRAVRDALARNSNKR